MSTSYDNSPVFARAYEVSNDRFHRLRQMKYGGRRELPELDTSTIIDEATGGAKSFEAKHNIMNRACRFILEDEK